MRWAGHVAYIEERRGVYRILEGRLEGRTALGRPRRRWENNIKKYLKEVGWRGVNRIALARVMDRWPALVNAVMNFRVPQNAGNFLTSRGTVSFSGRTLLHIVIRLNLYTQKER